MFFRKISKIFVSQNYETLLTRRQEIIFEKRGAEEEVREKKKCVFWFKMFPLFCSEKECNKKTFSRDAKMVGKISLKLGKS